MKVNGWRAKHRGTALSGGHLDGLGRADFIHKLLIVLKELRESRFWLRLILETGIVSKENAVAVYAESNELCNIIGKSVVTARKSSAPKP